MSSQPISNKRSKLLYSLVLLLLVLSAGWVISPVFSGPRDSVGNNASPVQDSARPMSLPGGSAAPQGAPDRVPASAGASGHAIVSWDVKHDVSPPLSSMKPLPPTNNPRREHENEFTRTFGAQNTIKDPVLQDWFSPLVMPTPILNFEGINTGAIPPDTNGDVGPNHYVQWVNTSFIIYNKAGGTVFGPANGNTIWSGFGGPCQTTNDGDPIVLYDPMADRWLFSQLGNAFSTPHYQCIAVSQTANPTGPYNRYAFNISNTQLNDYPKFGVWPDAYYMSANQFQGGFQGPAAVAFDRTRMLSGLSATMQKFDQTNSVLSSQYFGLLPSDLDGPTQPPAGSPNYFITWDGQFLNQLYLFRFHVDWATPANSTVTGPTVLNTAGFVQLCASCMTQPGTSQTLDTLAQDTMYRLAYRNFGTYEALVTNHSVDATGTNRAGVRWYEIRNPNGSPFIFQQGTYSPDGDNRWMGSIAMDHVGNMAMVYSVSSSSTFPSIRYAGRLVGDTSGTMGQGEATLMAGTGSQSGGFCSPNCNRWGDYSMMSVDPADDCTFWYTSEYIQVTGGVWRTRIGAFRFPSCNNFTATPTPTATSTRTATSTFTVTRTPTSTPTPTNITAYAYFSPAGPQTVVLNQKFTLDLMINAGNNAYPDGLNTQQSYLTFTNSIVKVVTASGSSCTPVSTVVPDIIIFDGVLQNEVCNGPAACGSTAAGSLAYASGALINCNGDGDPDTNDGGGCPDSVNHPDPDPQCCSPFRVAQVPMCGVAVGDAVLHWEFSPPAPAIRDSELITINVEQVQNRTLYQDYVIHVIAPSPTPTGSQLVGHVTMQGRPAQPNALQSVPVTLTLKLGTTEINYPSQNTDASGFFTVTSPGPGTYNWRVKNPQTLANSGSVTLPSLGTTQQEMGLLRAGDANNDNCVSAVDFSILRNSFGKGTGDPGYDARADFNGDNVVNSGDFSLLRNNFGQCGANPISPES